MLFVAGALSSALGCSPSPLNAGFEALGTLPAGDPVALEDLCPLQPGARSYTVSTGPGAGERIARRRSTTQRFAANWVDDEGGRRSEFWRLDQDANLVMPAVIEHADGAISLFDPPLVVAYRSLPAGQTRRQEVAMRVVDLADPALQRESGRATRTIEYVDDQTLRTPLGELVAKRVVVTFEADLQFADARTTSTLYVVPGLGPVVEQHREIVRVLGIPTRDRRRTLVLRSGEGTEGLRD
ncbi:MAG: hypothetical protein ACYS0G_12335 [Planctomycetota bacterium]|jgi:hypothetical protein